MVELLQGIFTHFSSTKMNLYLYEVPQGTELPYCMYFIINSTADGTFDNQSGIESTEIQFSIFADTALKAGQLGQEIEDLYNDCNLIINNYQFVNMKKKRTSLMKNEDVWHRVVTYDLITNKL